MGRDYHLDATLYPSSHGSAIFWTLALCMNVAIVYDVHTHADMTLLSQGRFYDGPSEIYPEISM
jgi:hypothetical protein